MRIAAIVVMVCVLVSGVCVGAFANEPKDKLSRGVANVFSSVLEIPQNIDTEWKESKNAVVGCLAGTFKGLFWGLARAASGLWDVATFAFPLPEEYGSIIQPEYVQRGQQTHLVTDKEK